MRRLPGHAFGILYHQENRAESYRPVSPVPVATRLFYHASKNDIALHLLPMSVQQHRTSLRVVDQNLHQA